MGSIAYINGELLPIDQASVNIEDRGYQFGDGIYEVVVSYNGSLFKLDAHLERLKRSAEVINLEINHSITEIRDICQKVFSKSKLDFASLYIQVTRGVSPRQHNIPENYEPNLIITVREKPEPAEMVKAVTAEDLRWKKCCVKTTNLLPNVLAKRYAHDSGCDEAILIREGNLMEGTSTNIFLVKDGVVLTPPADDYILEGITRNTVLNLIEERGYSSKVRYIKAQELFSADEVFLTGTYVEVMPVVEIDGVTINGGKPGPYTKTLREDYRNLLAP